MRVLYGVNGEGMGHATRSHVVIDALLPRHDVRVVASGVALRYLRDHLPQVDEIFGPTFAMGEGEIRRWRATAERIVRRCVGARGGGIILLHDGGHTAPDVDRSRSVAATGEPLRRFADEGYGCVTVPELVASSPGAGSGAPPIRSCQRR